MIRNLTIYVLILISLNSCAQHLVGLNRSKKRQKLSFNDSLNNLKHKLRDILDDHWIVTNTDSSILITFCQSCINEYKKELQEFNDSIADENHASGPQGKNYFLKYQENKRKYDQYCNSNRMDSVYINYLTSVRGGIKKNYKNNAVLQFTFDFKPKNRNDNLKRIQQKNDSIAEIIKDRPLKIPASIFDDYRFYEYEYLKRFDSSFTITKLPYQSKKYNYNIYFHSTIDLSHNMVEFQNSEGKITTLNSDIARTLIVVTYYLGIEEYVDHVLTGSWLK